MDLKGKVVVYVGGFGGIGLATCKVLASKGVKKLIVLDISLKQEALAQLQRLNANTHFMPFDICADLNGQRKVLHELVNKFGSFDVLVNGAGTANTETDFIPKLIKINFEGPVLTTLAALELYDKRQGGLGDLTILNICSVTALNPWALLPVYSATKAALLAYSKSCALHYTESGVTIIAVCPGLTDTVLLNEFKNSEGYSADFPTQTAAQCGENIVKTLEKNVNGSVWVLDQGGLKLVEERPAWEKPQGLL